MMSLNILCRAVPLCAVAVLLACTPAPEAVESETATIASVQEAGDYFPGFIDSYRDRTTGELFFLLQAEQLDTEILHFPLFLDGNAATYTQRGIHADESVIRFHRRFNQLHVEKLDTTFYFDPQHPLARAAEANLPPSVLATLDILDEDESGALLISANGLFLSEALLQVKYPVDADAEPAFTLGELSDTKTTLLQNRTYPENIDVSVRYVYENPQPLVSADPVVVDSRFVSVQVQHSLVAAPQPGFKPRTADSRVGTFIHKVEDMTSRDETPWRDVVKRWRLQKEDPEARLSDPLEPIVFWLENTTPVEWRETVKDAVLVWNKAFEQAGFSNAIEVRQQPDDASWESGDLRYNVLRWTSVPEVPWGGYGPVFSDPRTGEILGSDIMLEYDWIRTFSSASKLYAGAATLPRSGEAAAASIGARSRRQQCGAAAMLKEQLALGRAALKLSRSASPGLGEAVIAGYDADEHELIRQSLYDLVTHEVGHVLGLAHNFQASMLQSTATLTDPELPADTPLTASIMEYPLINLQTGSPERPRYYMTEPGPYDEWAIEFVYTPALDDPAQEQQRVERLLSRSTEPELAFSLDADTVNTETGIDPRAMRFDLGSDPLTYARQRLELLNEIGDGLVTRYQAPGESWQSLYNAYRSLHLNRYRQLIMAARWVGGVFVDNARQGQVDAGLPFMPVPRKQQLSAMALLRDHLFAPDALLFDATVYRYLQRQRRGWDAWNAPQDPKLHGDALQIQQAALSQLLAPVTTARILDTSLYGNAYSLSELLSDLTAAIFDADENAQVSTLRQQLQREYVEALLAMAVIDSGTAHNHVARGQAWYVLDQLRVRLAKLVARPPVADQATLAHRSALIARIESGLTPKK